MATHHWIGLNMPEIDVRNKAGQRLPGSHFSTTALIESLKIPATSLSAVQQKSRNPRLTPSKPLGDICWTDRNFFHPKWWTHPTNLRSDKVELQVDQGPDAYITDTTVGRSLGFCWDCFAKQRWGMAWWMSTRIHRGFDDGSVDIFFSHHKWHGKKRFVSRNQILRTTNWRKNGILS